MGTSAEAITIFRELLPGFIALEVFFRLAPYRRQNISWYVVHGLILTLLVQTGELVASWLLTWVVSGLGGELLWTEGIGLLASVVLAVGLGAILAMEAERNWLGSLLVRLGVSRRDAYPSNWYAAFAENKRYVVLHLLDGRRLQGWPSLYPDQSGDEHFLLCRAAWLVDGGTINLDGCVSILIPSSVVELVEFLEWEDLDDPEATQEEPSRAEPIAGSCCANGPDPKGEQPKSSGRPAAGVADATP